jgi:hypothetical protein
MLRFCFLAVKIDRLQDEDRQSVELDHRGNHEASVSAQRERSPMPHERYVLPVKRRRHDYRSCS